jgi:DcaP outer membrane protein
MNQHSLFHTVATATLVTALQPMPAASQPQEGQASVPKAVPGAVTTASSEKTVNRFYGALEVHAIRDFGQPGPSDLFTDLGSQPLDNSGGPKGRTRYTAETSRLGFETSTSISGGPLAAKIEVDFYGYSPAKRNKLRLRQAYVEYSGWLVGKTWSTFMDLDNLPETVDFNGPIGAPFSRRTMLRYSFGDAEKNLKWTLAIENPADQFAGGSADEKSPMLVARVDKTFPTGALNVRVMTHEKRTPTDSKRGYGFGVGGRYKLSDKDTLMAQYTRVDGDIDMLYGSNGYGINPDTGALTFDKNQGIVLGYARIFSEQLRGNVAMGWNRGKTAQALDNRSLNQLFVNLIYTPLKNLDLGLELIRGQRKDFADNKGTMRRMDVMARYSF